MIYVKVFLLLSLVVCRVDSQQAGSGGVVDGQNPTTGVGVQAGSSGVGGAQDPTTGLVTTGVVTTGIVTTGAQNPSDPLPPTTAATTAATTASTTSARTTTTSGTTGTTGSTTSPLPPAPAPPPQDSGAVDPFQSPPDFGYTKSSVGKGKEVSLSSTTTTTTTTTETTATTESNLPPGWESATYQSTPPVIYTFGAVITFAMAVVIFIGLFASIRYQRINDLKEQRKNT
jgi:hypothetical protein